MKDILIIGLSLILAKYFAEILYTYIVYKKRIKTYKEIVEEYDLDVELPKTYKQWYNFNMKMFEYHKKNDIVDYLYYLDHNNLNGKISEE